MILKHDQKVLIREIAGIQRIPAEPDGISVVTADPGIDAGLRVAVTVGKCGGARNEIGGGQVRYPTSHCNKFPERMFNPEISPPAPVS